MPTSPDPSLPKCQTREQLAELLGVSVSTLTYFAYGTGRKYTQFSLPKKSGGVRTITAPVDGLLEIQKKLATELNKLYPAPNYVHGFVTDRSVLSNAVPHLNKKQVFNLDLKDFFPSISSHRIIGLLKSHPFNLNTQIASTIAGLTCFNKSLPQGAPTSPVLSNMICFRMDRAIRQLCKINHVVYSRYADDLTFSSSRQLPETIAFVDEINGLVRPGSELEEIIRENHFKLNPLKSRLSKNQQAKYVTGVKVNLTPNVSRDYVRQIRNMLNAWRKYGLDAAQKDFENKFGGGDRRFIDVLRGKIAYLKSIKTDSDLTYAKIYNSFVELEDKGRVKLPVNEIEKLLPRVYVVESEGKKGTAFVLNKEWLITCSHVISENPANAYFFTYDRYTRAERSIATPHEEWRSSEDNFDLISLPFNQRNTGITDKSFDLAPASYQVETGGRYKIVGFPDYTPGSPPHTMTIEVTAIRQNGKYKHAFVAQKMIGGYSGSPVLNESNQVVGVVQRGTHNYQTGDNSIGYTFLPIQELRKYLQELSEAS